MAEPWLIDELAHAGPEHLDPDFVAAYDRKAGYDRPEGRRQTDGDLAVLRRHGVSPTSTLVDFGAGTGQFALAAAAQVERVVAVDVAPAMLAVLGERAAAAGRTNVECVQAGFLSYRHAGSPVDAVYTRNALHHLPDFWKAYALHRIARLLRPGGVLRLRDLIYDFEPGQTDEVFDRWFAGTVADPAAGYTHDDLAEHVRTEFSTYRWLLEPMLGAAGFEIVDVDFQASVYGAYTCVRR